MFIRSVVCAILCLLGIGTAQSQNLLVNGGFETPLVVSGPYEHRSGSELTGWTLFSTYKGTVQFNSIYDLVSEGAQAVQIEIRGDWISQSFATVIGQSYMVSFDLYAYSSSYGGIGVINVTRGSISETFIGTTQGYTHNTLGFVADSLTTELKFENSAPTISPNYPQLDNVSVVAIPEPETYAMLLAGLGLLGFIARRRKQQAD